MKVVVFGLSISSSWGNGHATLWRGLCRALARRGHSIVFFERDAPYYAAHRDGLEFEGCDLRLYADWRETSPCMLRHVRDADVAIVTSFCPDALQATELVLASAPGTRVFYDLDAPVTLAQLRAGRPVSYVGAAGLRDFDLVLSYTGGGALEELVLRLGAVRVAPLYGCVDPDVHVPVPARAEYASDLSYLGTYSEDRQATLETLLLEPARRLAHRRFAIGGSLYPESFPWRNNILYFQHVAPPEHPTFYCSSGFTLNVTRRPMAEMGFCPSGRLFEAAACGVPIVSDAWDGLERFFTPSEEILVCRSSDDVVRALSLSQAERSRLAARARDRVLSEHTAERRARELERILDEALDASRGASLIAATTG